MACAVYCMVRYPEELDPLIARLRDAGVETEDIAVVLRRNTEMFSSNLSGISHLILILWNLSFNWMAALWWPLAFGMGRAMSAANDHAVVPLNLYRAGHH